MSSDEGPVIIPLPLFRQGSPVASFLLAGLGTQSAAVTTATTITHRPSTSMSSMQPKLSITDFVQAAASTSRSSPMKEAALTYAVNAENNVLPVRLPGETLL
ncbi:hypothetical protein BJV82DRAFT_662249 [Fennellomyces sp. T-0311]|nr:hypothetical protein BJV82DRAFT_662249 [Fennellomyces sp. T-0311]